jgi:hypothetical protein
MPIKLKEENGGKILIIHATGKLVKKDYGHLVSEFARLVRLHGRLRVLFDMTGFHGWNTAAMWEDIKFDLTHFADIERLAMVGDHQWQHFMAIFFKPFTNAESRYFDHADVVKAQKWLRSGNRNRKPAKPHRRNAGPKSSGSGPGKRKTNETTNTKA